MSCVLNLPQKEKSRMPVMAAIVKAPPFQPPYPRRRRWKIIMKPQKEKGIGVCGMDIFETAFLCCPLKDFFIHPERDVFVSEKPIFVESRRRENENRN
ncbi:hypothetical protein TNCV_5116121 [Trichonephila clavipes]|nr:hypothetical protein TNCV_5116121 [Trichonephila clavipes]